MLKRRNLKAILKQKFAKFHSVFAKISLKFKAQFRKKHKNIKITEQKHEKQKDKKTKAQKQQNSAKNKIKTKNKANGAKFDRRYHSSADFNRLKNPARCGVLLAFFAISGEIFAPADFCYGNRFRLAHSDLWLYLAKCEFRAFGESGLLLLNVYGGYEGEFARVFHAWAEFF